MSSGPVARAVPASRHRTSVVGIIGEVLITVGIVVLLYVVWQLWIGDAVIGAQNNAAGAAQSEEWNVLIPTSTPSSAPSPTPTASPQKQWDPVVMAQPADGEVFGVMRIPRFGADYETRIAGGVSRSVTLDRIGIGHYPGTSMPGDIGNFAVAAHRTTWGAPFGRIADLHIGDAIVIETQAGWYTYRFRTLEYVPPTALDVLASVPQVPDAPADGRYLTMTSCSPKFSRAERIIAYSVFESFQPRAEGEPHSLTDPVGA